MSYETINVGDLPNDGTGDPVRVAFIKTNNNFSRIQTLLDPAGVTGALQFKTVVYDSTADTYSNTMSGTANLTFVSSTNTLNLQGKLVPLTDGNLELGANDKRISNLFLTSTALKIGNINVSESNNSLTFAISNSQIQPTLNFGNLTVTSNLSYSNSKFTSTQATTTTDGSNIVILSISLNDIKNGILHIVSRRAGSSDSQSATMEIHINNLGTSLSHTIYGTVFVGNVLTTYDATVNTGNVEIKVSPLYDETIVHYIDYKLTK